MKFFSTLADGAPPAASLLAIFAAGRRRLRSDSSEQAIITAGGSLRKVSPLCSSQLKYIMVSAPLHCVATAGWPLIAGAPAATLLGRGSEFRSTPARSAASDPHHLPRVLGLIRVSSSA